MRRIALTGLLLLSGCTGFDHFIGQTHTLASNPNKPTGNDSLSMQRADGNAGAVTPLVPQTGQVWPTAIPTMPTLADIQKQMDLSGSASPQLGPVPASPGQIPNLSTLPGMQGGTSQAPVSGGAVRPPTVGNPLSTTAPLSGMSATAAPPSLTMPKLGTQITTPQGATTIIGGTANYQTLAPINGQSGAILIPNGNGTSTLVMPNGTISSVPSPK
ncbi:hypothetical protein ACELLULO517_02820 [Acidisoma cellulosilytica]|uniref:Lipoprotein n=1 Tax=Acidisoma cellulosilyticum TaxID=2802395 RepID=A0A964E2T7_9PROT|nr:hypothetical protein [Acidisoma cellulosilyticum]MCB8879153.1 hypothetical protein [Acidisoma cellulosilyticum]